MFYLTAATMLGKITHYFANFNGTTNTCRTVMLWLAIALTLSFIVCKFAIKRERQPLVNKISLLVALIASGASIVTFTVCSFIYDEIVAITFYPLLVFVICCVVGALVIAIKPQKAVKIAVAATVCAALISALVCMIVYYSSGDASEHNWISKDDVNSIGLYISSVAVVIIIVVLAFLTDRTKTPFNSHIISFAAVCVSLSFALSYVRIFKMPMGGSITFVSTLPLMLFSFMFGSRKGILIGFIHGALQAVQDPWILHPAQFLLDYAVAFTAIGTAGCIKDLGLFAGKKRIQFVCGAAVAGLLRLVCHFFSGAFAFGSAGIGAAEDFAIPALANPFVYSLVYQTMYVVPDVIIAICAGVTILSSKNFVKQMERFAATKKAPEPSTEESAQT